MSTVYYNVQPPISKEKMAAYCVGAYHSTENGIRLIIKRDLSIPLSELSVSYRFSDFSVRQKDPDNPYFTRVYSSPSINENEYIVIKLKTPELFPNGISAVVSAVTLENGEKIFYRTADYNDTDQPSFGADGYGASREFREYINSRKAGAVERTSASAVSVLTKKFEKVVLDENEYNLNEAESTVTDKKKIPVKHIAVGVAGLLLLLLIAVLVLTLRNAPTAPSVSALLEKGEYAAAYKTAMSIRDYEKAEEICRIVYRQSIAENDFERAYLYAKASPEPFDHDFMVYYASLLIAQGRGDEAYTFLSDKPEYADILDTVIRSIIDSLTGENDYKAAFDYAARAPEPLDLYVMENIASDIILGGEVNSEIIALLRECFDAEGLNKMATETTDAFMESGMYMEAGAIASLIDNEEVRLSLVKSVCETGVPYYIEKSDIQSAVMLFDFSADYIDEETQNSILTFAVSVSRRLSESAGVIIFGSRRGEDTSDVIVKKEDASVRSSFAIVWNMLTPEQKRAYHSRELDIYKEAFRIEDNTVAGVDAAVSVAVSERIVAVLCRDGAAVTANVDHYSALTLPTDTDNVQIDAGREHVLLLKDNGTVVAIGDNTHGQCNTAEWTNVVKIAAGADFSVALRSDGTLCACGANSFGQLAVDSFTDIVDIAVNDRCTVLLTRDGVVRVIGDITMGLEEADRVEGVRRIRAGGSGIILEITTKDYMYFSGAKNAEPVDYDSWRSLREFAVGAVCVSYIDQYGKMNTEGAGAPITHAGYNVNG